MRNEAPFADFEGRESAVKDSVMTCSFTGSASASDMTSGGFGEIWMLTLGKGRSRMKSEGKVHFGLSRLQDCPQFKDVATPNPVSMFDDCRSLSRNGCD